jgi:hypothetical protein
MKDFIADDDLGASASASTFGEAGSVSFASSFAVIADGLISVVVVDDMVGYGRPCDGLGILIDASE